MTSHLFQPKWPYSPEEPSLPHNEVQVWCASLNRPKSQLLSFFSILTKGEQERASRFYFERDRDHYIAARGILRTLIGRYLQLSPGQVEFVYGEFGKPELSAKMPADGLQFNISHAQGVGLFGFTRGRDIGVDVEQIRPLEDAEEVAERFFSANENEMFAAVSEDQKPEAFFNCWTRKEAFIKAIGEGLSCPLDSFDVTLKPGEKAQLLRIDGSTEAAARWMLCSLSPGSDYVGAVIASSNDWQLQCWQLATV
jgi:4'-phosphopantetheinyl transferase